MNYKLNENLELVPMRNTYKPLSVGLLLVLLVGVILYAFREESIKIVYKVVHPTSEQTKDVELSEPAIVKCLHDNGCVLPNVAVAQAKLESNLGKSNVGKNAKNMFGITHHKCQYVAGKFGVYAKYETYEDNIKCYIHIQDHYLSRIDGVYASDTKYVSLLKSMK
jgi:flagellum-specific peptidoglycan hydrolase FlgJ